jgi:hypothetical protein
LFTVNAGAVPPSIRAEIRTRDLQFFAGANLCTVAYMIHLKKLTCRQGSEDSFQLKKVKSFND